MRLTYLDEAARSYKKARKLDKTLDSKNLDALKEHVAHQKENAGKGNGSGNQEGGGGGGHGGRGRRGQSPDALTVGRYSAEGADEAVDALDFEYVDGDLEFDLDLSLPFGVTLTDGARVAAHAEGWEGQFAAAGVGLGDRVVGALGTRAVHTLAQLKRAIEAERALGRATMAVTVRSLSGGGSGGIGGSGGGSVHGGGDDDAYGGDNAYGGNMKLPGLDGSADEATLVKAAIKFVGDGKHAEALPYFRQAAENSPGKASLWMNVGNCQRDVGRFPDAMSSYQRALALEPGNELLLENVKQFQEEHGSEAASSWFDQARPGEGFCDDGSSVEAVTVGQRVEVRDAGGGAWSVGVVESIDEETGHPSVAKEGWDMGYEWDECRLLGKAAGRDEL
jgi:tetratricopeptide (TPR) repeat protein